MNILINELQNSKKFSEVINHIKETKSPISLSGLSDMGKIQAIAGLHDSLNKNICVITYNQIQAKRILKEMPIDEEEYQDNLSKTSIPNLISYIHDSIQILITNKIETAKIEQKQEDTKLFQNPTISANANFHTPPIEIYEKIILKLEEKNVFKLPTKKSKN